MANVTLLILAAGIGSRYGGIKQLQSVGSHGERLMDYSVQHAVAASFNKVVLVIRPELENEFQIILQEWKEKYNIAVDFVFQELSNIPKGFSVPSDRKKPWGTGHAVLCAKDIIKEPFAVINADDYYGKHSYQVLSQYLQNAPENQYAMVAFALGNTLSAHGTVSRGVCVVDEENNLQQIQEYTEIQKLNDTIVCGNKEFPFKTPVSLNFWGFTPAIFPWFQEAFIEYLTNPTKNEFQLPDVIHQGIQKNKFSIKVLSSKEQWLGMTYIQDKEWVQNYLKNEENYERI